jgi:hypothetical protein
MDKHARVPAVQEAAAEPGLQINASPPDTDGVPDQAKALARVAARTSDYHFRIAVEFVLPLLIEYANELRDTDLADKLRCTLPAFVREDERRQQCLRKYQQRLDELKEQAAGDMPE